MMELEWIETPDDSGIVSRYANADDGTHARIRAQPSFCVVNVHRRGHGSSAQMEFLDNITRRHDETYPQFTMRCQSIAEHVVEKFRELRASVEAKS